MIVLRIVEGAWQHAGARYSEWVGAVGLTVMGYQLLAQPGIFEISPSFSFMQQWGDQAAWANVLLAAGLIRTLALVLNGTLPWMRPYSPTLRFAASWISFMTWGAVALGMYYAWQNSGGSPTGWVAYGIYIAPHELRNIAMTRADMNAVRREAYALAGKQ